MRTRLILHFFNGNTWTGVWDCIYDLKELFKESLSSLQIQEENGKIHTLSSKRKQTSTFWQRDYIKNKKIYSRSILKKIGEITWVDLNLDCLTGKRTINIIREHII